MLTSRLREERFTANDNNFDEPRYTYLTTGVTRPQTLEIYAMRVIRGIPMIRPLSPTGIIHRPSRAITRWHKFACGVGGRGGDVYKTCL